MDWQERIVIDPEILVGKPVIKGTRLAVEFVIELLSQGWSQQEILENYPGITEEDILACLRVRDRSFAFRKGLSGWGSERVGLR